MLFSGGFASDVMGRIRHGRAVCGRTEKNASVDLFFIGKELKQKHAQKLRRDFLGCAAEEPLRFKVGDKVQAQVWRLGQCMWSSKRGTGEICYRLELEDKKRTDVWVPSIRHRSSRRGGRSRREVAPSTQGRVSWQTEVALESFFLRKSKGWFCMFSIGGFSR